MKIKNVADVAGWRLCTGCGACAFGCPENAVTLVDFMNDGIRPVIASGPSSCKDCSECLDYCPGIGVSHGPGKMGRMRKEVGPVIEVWEGHASDEAVRFNGSSGGAASALAAYCMEKEGMHGALHTGAAANEPLRNATRLSRSREELLANSGSRYCPASPCEGLSMIEQAPSPCVFIGKPCDIEGLRKAQAKRPLLREKTGLSIGIFCAGTPSTLGTVELLRSHGMDIDGLKLLRYRGNGWPGKFQASSGKKTFEATYKESWSFLQKFRPFRCYLCPDGTSEFADVSCGDPWHRGPDGKDPGRSIVIARTELGKRVLRRAIKAGYLTMKKVDPALIARSQENLMGKKRALWGRLLAMRLLGLPTPVFKGFGLYESWLKLEFREKARSVAGTVKRIFKRNYFRPAQTLGHSRLEETLHK